METSLPVLMELRVPHVWMEIGQSVQMEHSWEGQSQNPCVLMEEFQNVVMEETLPGQNVQIGTDLNVQMEPIDHHVLMEISQCVPMEQYLENHHVKMEVCQLVQMEQLLESLVEDFVKMEGNLNVQMETALYVQMEQKVPHVLMEPGLSAWMIPDQLVQIARVH